MTKNRENPGEAPLFICMLHKGQFFGEVALETLVTKIKCLLVESAFKKEIIHWLFKNKMFIMYLKNKSFNI